MEINDLKIFERVAYHGSITKAANNLNYVQSYITTRIQALEAEFNTKLFRRHSRGMILTSDGARALTYTKELLSLVEEMLKNGQTTNYGDRITIGTIETVTKLPMLLSKYRQNLPGVEVTLVAGVTKALVNDVINHRLDGAFVTRDDINPMLLRDLFVFQDELALITNSQVLDFDDILSQPFLVFDLGCIYRERLKKWFAHQKLRSAKMLEFGTLDTILRSVISGLGVTILPKSSVVHLAEIGIIRYHPIPEKYSQVATVFVYRTDSVMTKSVEILMETINNVADSMAFRPSND